MIKEYIPYEVMEQNGPPEITAPMYRAVVLMMGEVIPLVYDRVRPIIGRFEPPALDLPESSRVGARADRFCQAAAAFKEAIEKKEQRELRSDEVPWYFDKALEYLVGLGFYERADLKKIDWPPTMTFHKMQVLKDNMVSAFRS